MFYPQELVDRVIDANNIVDVIGSYVKLTKKGSTYFGLCPFHNEKTPSFSVTDNGTKKMYYCFGCHKGGTVLTFIMKYENVSYTEALKQLADRAGIELPAPNYSREERERARRREEILEVNKEAAVYFYRLLKSERGARAYEYLKDRGLTDETITSFGLGYSDKYRDDLYRYIKEKGYSDELLKATGLFSIKETDTHDYFWNRVMFPIMDVRGKVVAFGGRVMGDGEPKYLNSPETECFNKRRTLYGLNVAKGHKGKSLILCEGYMDVIALHQAGFTNAVASLGTAFTDGHAGTLKRYAGSVVISFDSDTAGRDAALRAIPRLKDAGLSVKVADLSPYKDPDELIKAEGAEEYKERLKNAQNGLLFEIECLSLRYDTNDPDEKTRLNNEIARRLSYISDPMESDSYIRAVSEKYDIDINTLNAQVKRFALNRDDAREYQMPAQDFSEKKEKSGALVLCEKMLLSYIARDVSLYDRVHQVIDENDFSVSPYDKVAAMLFEQIENGGIRQSSIISAFEDSETQEKVAEIFEFIPEGETGPEEREREINECVIRMKENTLERQIADTEDAQAILRLKKEEEKLRKIDIFGREK